jgi:hypothetical protein
LPGLTLSVLMGATSVLMGDIGSAPTLQDAPIITNAKTAMTMIVLAIDLLPNSQKNSETALRRSYRLPVAIRESRLRDGFRGVRGGGRGGGA